MQVSVRRLLVVLAVAGAGFVPAPATAALCSGSGVSVVVDHGALGGGIDTACDNSGNRNAAKAFTNTGHQLRYAAAQPGFVCRVDGVPDSDPCVNTSPANAYWGLYWSDGTSGWKYASTSVGSLTVPAGGTVALSWQNGGAADPPGVAPAKPAPESHGANPTPTKNPTKQPAHGTTSAPRSGTPTVSAAASSSDTTPPTPSGRATATPLSAGVSSPSPSATADAPAAVSRTTSPLSGPADDEDSGGLAWWVPVGVLLGLGVGGGAAWWTRRSRGTT